MCPHRLEPGETPAETTAKFCVAIGLVLLVVT